ncbi:DUF3299 domain-containing protein [Bacillus timonensis]|nr:DUF3299 domain-containing protein [Bacillus timonensis]
MRFSKLVIWVFMLLVLAACGANGEKEAEKSSSGGDQQDGPVEITFADFFTKSTTGDGQITEKMKELNGKKVAIKGYMTELTPIDNRFMYLVPTAGAACPFCSADNPKYLEAIAVYPPDGEEGIPYTEEAIWAYGTLEVGEEVDEATGLISMFRLKAESIDIYQPR